MNKMRVKAGVVSTVVGVLILGFAMVANAYSGGISSSLIDWSAMQITATPGMAFTYSLQGTETIGASTSPNDYQIAYNAVNSWADSSATTSLTSDAYNLAVSTVLADNLALSQNSIASANLLGTYMAATQATRSGYFTVAGAGRITITIPYDISLQVYADAPPLESARGLAGAGLYMLNTSNYSASSDYQFLQDVTGAQGGFLTASLDFLDGQSGSFQVLVEGGAEASSVPEPSTMSLLGLGLAGAALLRKRKKS